MTQLCYLSGFEIWSWLFASILDKNKSLWAVRYCLLPNRISDFVCTSGRNYGVILNVLIFYLSIYDLHSTNLTDWNLSEFLVDWKNIIFETIFFHIILISDSKSIPTASIDWWKKRIKYNIPNIFWYFRYEMTRWKTSMGIMLQIKWKKFECSKYFRYSASGVSKSDASLVKPIGGKWSFQTHSLDVEHITTKLRK